MTSSLHDGIVDLIRSNPQYFVPMLRRAFGEALPNGPIRTGPTEVPQHIPPSLRSDLVLHLGPDDHLVGIIIEVQITRDDDKSWSWPLYFAHLRYHLRAEVIFVVVAPDPSVALWAARCVRYAQDGMAFVPLNLGAETIARIVDVEVARRMPELAILSTLVHAGHDDTDLANAVAAAISTLPRARGAFYAQLVARHLSEAARSILEAYKPMLEESEITFPPLVDLVDRVKAKGKIEGKIEGKAESILVFLSARGMTPDAEQRVKILACADPAQLDAWLQAAATIESVDVLLGMAIPTPS